MNPSDERIRKRISDLLHQDANTSADNVVVMVKGGVVTLSGEVPTEHDFVATRTAAWGTDDVTDVVNELSVRPVTPAAANRDAKIAAGVKSRLDNARNVDSSRITPSVNAGVVTLTGTVTASWQKESLETKTVRVSGVARVVNKIAVVPTGKESDIAIAERVVAVLDREQMIDARKITVEVNDGVVTLTGVVSGWTSMGVAENAAAFTAGVTGIHNRLTVPM